MPTVNHNASVFSQAIGLEPSSAKKVEFHLLQKFLETNKHIDKTKAKTSVLFTHIRGYFTDPLEREYAMYLLGRQVMQMEIIKANQQAKNAIQTRPIIGRA